MSTAFPFSAVVGQDDAKLALVLNAIDPGVGGVLLRGQKGSAKTTLARALAVLLDEGAPFVELPVGATEDRLIGSIDVTAALAGGTVEFSPGLLAAAHGGVLYVDEVNLLPDHLVDVLLDVAASGVNRVEREGISQEHPSRFVLVGSMNPEEGDLRPQLLDRFGLAVEVATSTEPRERAEAVSRRLAFEGDPSGFLTTWSAAEAELRARLRRARVVPLVPALLERVSGLCASVGAEGLRADLTIARAAAALAGWEGADEASIEHVRRVAPLALAHRRRRTPFEEPGVSPDEIDEGLGPPPPDAEENSPPPTPGSSEGGGSTTPPTVAPPAAAPADAATPVVRLEAERSHGAAAGRRSITEGRRGRLVADRPFTDTGTPVAVAATARAAAVRRAGEPADQCMAPVERDDLRSALRRSRSGNLVILAVDASGSMGAQRRMEAAKGAVQSLLLDAYQRRDRVALVTFRGDGADVVLRPTASTEVASARLSEVAVGGRTPLAAGLLAALAVAEGGGSDGGHRPLVVVVSDGRATAGPPGADPWAAACAAAERFRHRGVASVVIDAEDGATRLGLARELASAMGARYLALPDLTARSLHTAVRQATP